MHETHSKWYKYSRAAQLAYSMRVARHFCTRNATRSQTFWSMWIHIAKCAGYESACLVLGLGASGEVFRIGRMHTSNFRSLGMRANDPLDCLCG